jgi:hypothetical protein
MRIRLLVALVLGGVAAPLAAQAPQSNLYLPISSWTTPYVEHLIRAGVLQGLDPLTRPLKRADVARAVAKVDTTELAESVKGTLRLLAQELEERPDTVRWKLEANVAAQGASDPSRWAVRPAPENSGLFWQGGLTGSLEFPHVGIVTSPYFDTRLLRDNQFTGYKQRFIAGWNAETYVLASWKYLDLFFGSEHGGQTAATLYTLVQSARRNCVDVWPYLTDVLRRIPAITPGDTAELEALLPDRWVAAHPEHRLEQREEESREAQARRRRKRAARRLAVTK